MTPSEVPLLPIVPKNGTKLKSHKILLTTLTVTGIFHAKSRTFPSRTDLAFINKKVREIKPTACAEKTPTIKSRSSKRTRCLQMVGIVPLEGLDTVVPLSTSCVIFRRMWPHKRLNCEKLFPKCGKSRGQPQNFALSSADDLSKVVTQNTFFGAFSPQTYLLGWRPASAAARLSLWLHRTPPF